MHVAPGRLSRQVFLEPPVGLVDPAVEHQLCSTRLQPLRRELCQQSDRVVAQLTKANRVKFTKQIVDFRVPTPPQVAGQSHALVVEVLR